MRTHRTGGLASVGGKKKKAAAKSAVPLLITDLPRITLEQLSEVLSEAIRWHAICPLTEEQNFAQCKALIGLRQVQWHVNFALQGDSSPLVYLPIKGS